MVRKDDRPICRCDSYPFPHRIGGKCSGVEFTRFHFENVRLCCEFCNCNAGSYCDVESGREDIKHAECYIDQLEMNPGGYLPTVQDLFED